MPDAKTHDMIAATASLVVAPASYFTLSVLGDPPPMAFYGALWVTGAHLIGSFWLSPDLDIDSAIDDRWGPLFWIWRPYMWAVPHRHWLLSHSGVSGLFRLFYLYLVISIILITLEFLGVLLGLISAQGLYLLFQAWVSGGIQDFPRQVALIATGVVISDALHSVSDLASTSMKGGRGRRRRRRRR
jgi:uncharacterized metal-binding protein